jgi:hypothetical protein
MTVRGGLIGGSFRVGNAANVIIHGFDFAIDGVPVAGLSQVGDSAPIDVLAGSLFSGTWADGTPFAFQTTDGDQLGIGSITAVRALALPTGPPLIRVADQVAPRSVRGAQTLEVGVGGQLGLNFAAGSGSTVRVLGGTVGSNFESVGAIVDITAGTVERYFDAFAGSTINIQGGAIGSDFDAFAGSTVNISGGSVGSRLRAFQGSTINISGGAIGGDFSTGTTVNISGGTITTAFRLSDGAIVNMTGGTILGTTETYAGSVFNISGGTVGLMLVGPGSTINVNATEALLGGLPIPGLVHAGDTLIITDRTNVKLTGTLLAGTLFSIFLNNNRYRIDPDAILRVSLVYAPGDVNLDGIVNMYDVNLVSSNWGEAGPQGDANGDGTVNIFDINLISAHWNQHGPAAPGGGGAVGGAASAPAVPEPASIALLALAAPGLLILRLLLFRGAPRRDARRKLGRRGR